MAVVVVAAGGCGGGVWVLGHFVVLLGHRWLCTNKPHAAGVLPSGSWALLATPPFLHPRTHAPAHAQAQRAALSATPNWAFKLWALCYATRFRQVRRWRKMEAQELWPP